MLLNNGKGKEFSRDLRKFKFYWRCHSVSYQFQNAALNSEILAKMRGEGGVIGPIYVISGFLKQSS